ncbi:Os12g0527300 [Oryza sativa Japonica Group]|uniref:Os12g0527300 protein n=1 Tax=Oryza sativa subsp. japonica TaxID=39947 RepID=A0A0P0YAW4_ORYSJ|nr:Os12g0527300 [Oryza sativa Japonica Group]
MSVISLAIGGPLEKGTAVRSRCCLLQPASHCHGLNRLLPWASSRKSPKPPPQPHPPHPPPVVGLLARVVADASSCRGSCCHRNLFVPRVPPLLPLLPDQSFGNGGLGLWEEESER